MSIPNSQNKASQISNQPVFSVEFARIVENAVAWNHFVISKNINNSNLKLWFQSFLICFLATITTATPAYYYIINRITNFPIYFLVSFSLIFLIIYTIVIYFLFKFKSVNQTKKMAKNTTGFLEKTEFIFFEDRLSTKNTNIQVIRNYLAFTNFYENKDYLFLTQDRINAIVLPKKFFSKEQIEFVRNKIKSREK